MTKIDALGPELSAEQAKLLEAEAGVKPLLISSASGEGVKAALRAVARHLDIIAADEAGEGEEDEGWNPA